MMILLYLVEAESIATYGEKFTECKLLMTKESPKLLDVFSFLDSALNEKYVYLFENEYFVLKNEFFYDFENIEDFYEELTIANIKLLDSINKRFKNIKDDLLLNYLENESIIPEWSSNIESPYILSVQKLLTKRGYTEDEIKEIEDKIQEIEDIKAMWQEDN